MRPKRILVVDDDPDVTEYLGSFLEDHGFTVTSAGSSAAALELLQAEAAPPDVILIDVMMPGRSGLDLLVTLRRNPARAGIPLVVVTGDDQIVSDDCQSYLGTHHDVRGPDGILGKPVDRERLLEVVRQLCAGRTLDA